ncbi:RNA polymerase sigma factor RpoE [Labilithrix luteola]|uniref:RNA polymerase sigma factor RpoE n=1 Tax=Labilithrix luteola TaxID=1391654 RepID=A0A0K1QGE2_9BACT|nr:sigma-70 family RNA polymerase sigma factor [Labilithrix luteola]AKV04788.1 RNA polymerase sigma factor RpoE [Labilithrix luteola]
MAADAATGCTGRVRSRSAPFEELVRTHQSFVRRSALRFGVRSADAEDVVQQVFVVAARNLDKIHQDRAYLFRTCANISRNTRRRELRRREVNDDARLDLELDRRPSPEEAALASEARVKLLRLLDAMPEETRRSFVLYELEHRTLAEIAQITNAPIGTAASRVKRAREIVLGVRRPSKAP